MASNTEDELHAAVSKQNTKLSDRFVFITGGPFTPEARQLFEVIDPTLWSLTHHNPVKLLSDVTPDRLARLAEDPSFLRQYSAVFRLFDERTARLMTFGYFATEDHPLPGPAGRGATSRGSPFVTA